MKALDAVYRALRHVAGIALLRYAHTTTTGIRYLQLALRDRFTLDDIEHLEPFGFTSGPLAESEVLVLSPGGDRAQTLAILVHDRRYRLAVAPGEVALYNRHGDRVHLKDDRTIEISGGTQVLLNTPLVECINDLKVGGNAEIAGTSTAADHLSDGISGKGHTHREQGDGQLVGPPE